MAHTMDDFRRFLLNSLRIEERLDLLDSVPIDTIANYLTRRKERDFLRQQRRPQQVHDPKEANRRCVEQRNMLLDAIFYQYQQEGINMPYTMEDFRLDYLREHIHELLPEERLKGLTPGERLEGLSADELVAGLSPQQIEQLREKLNGDPQSRRPKKRQRK